MVEVRDVKSAARTVEVLEVLAGRRNRPISIRELSEAVGMPRSSTHALLRTLARHGWVRCDPTGSQYTIGIRALLAGTNYLDTDPYLPIVTTALEQLHAAFDETFHFGRLDGTDVVYLATRESTKYVRPYSRVGRRLPAFATSLGKAILADRSDREEHLPASLQPLTPNTIIDRALLLADIEETGRRGYAVDDEENSLGVSCFAVALPYTAPTTDAISVSVPTPRLTPSAAADLRAALQQAGDRIVRTVGPIRESVWT